MTLVVQTFVRTKLSVQRQFSPPKKPLRKHCKTMTMTATMVNEKDDEIKITITEGGGEGFKIDSCCSRLLRTLTCGYIFVPFFFFFGEKSMGA